MASGGRFVSATDPNAFMDSSTPVIVPGGGSNSGGGLGLDSSHVSSNGGGAYSPKITGFTPGIDMAPNAIQAGKLAGKMDANKFGGDNPRMARVKTAPHSKQRKKYVQSNRVLSGVPPPQ